MNAAKLDRPTILITGAGGALARRVLSQLKYDFNIVAVDFRRRVQTDRGMPSYRVSYHTRAFEEIFRDHPISGVLHIGRMGLYESDHKHRYTVNVLGTQKLLDLSLKYQVKKVVVLSTYYVYGASPYNPALITEDYPLKASELVSDLVDSVELENLANIYLWKYPELNMTILRPCNIVGPGVLNRVSQLFSRRWAPVITGFSPMMQFIHVDDMAEAMALAFRVNHPGVYNVAVEDWVSYQAALLQCGCRRVPVPNVTGKFVSLMARKVAGRAFPDYLTNYYKYPVIIDGSLFNRTFQFVANRSLDDIFSHYRETKELQVC
ncbi:MAG: NAD-dependent epimerase/dehydratase family protein [Gammaproteobacteria bacterium]